MQKIKTLLATSLVLPFSRSLNVACLCSIAQQFQSQLTDPQASPML